MGKKKPYPVMDITGGLSVEKDPIALLDKESPNLTNVRFTQQVMKKDVGFDTFGTGLPLDGVVMFMDTFYKYDGSEFILIVTDSWIYEYNSTSNTYAKRNATELTGTEDNAFSSATTLDSVGDDVYFLTNGVDPILYWDGTGSFVESTLYAKRLSVFKNRLILGNVTVAGTNNPKQVMWSTTADPFDMAGTGSGDIDLVDTVDWVTGLVPMKDKFFVVKERSIWELAWVGGTTYFTPMLKIDGVGSVASNSILGLGEDMIFFGNDNIYLYNGLSLDPIADQLFSMFYDTEQKVVASSFLARCTAQYIEELEEYWVAIPTVGERASTLFKYNFKTKSWVIKEVAISALGFYSVTAKDIWSDLTLTWSDQEWVWMEKALPAGAPTTLLGDADGYVYEDDRITRDTEYMVFETKDFKFEHSQRWCEFRAEVKGGVFTMSYSTDQGLTWSNPRSYTADADEYKSYVLYLNETSKNIRARIESFAEELDIKWVEPWYITRARQQEVISPT